MDAYGSRNAIPDFPIPKRILENKPTVAPAWMVDASRRIRFTLEVVSDSLLVDVVDIMAGTKTQELAEARAVSCWALSECTSLTVSQIAQRIGRRHHTSILSALKKMEQRRDKDEEYRKMTDRILERVKAARNNRLPHAA